ncbi:GNAT family N-acetyltransferase [Paludicola sp. MB14-C6]|uniref:GNAT family N-acetyltransferase n=1 Tax=Paludihabitans sp. MB14-C6 TaxID=3070656 RepID=UPI0027DDCA75|nr:GNAT family N-acetyltransferase [Paludicola sp. MB14-C6]WMJ22828.1 GNAT family N-acetyltransferase [Paludicola sp. MB14-C6]
MLDYIKVDDTNIDLLGLIHSKAWQASHIGIASESYWNTITPEHQTEYFKEKIQDSNNSYYLIFHNANAIGMISFNLTPTSPVGEVMQLYFLPEFCGQGYGKYAMDFAVDYFKAKNVHTIKLWAMNINEKALKFYKKYGYQYTGIENELDASRNITEKCFQYVL